MKAQIDVERPITVVEQGGIDLNGLVLDVETWMTNDAYVILMRSPLDLCDSQQVRKERYEVR